MAPRSLAHVLGFASVFRSWDSKRRGLSVRVCVRHSVDTGSGVRCRVRGEGSEETGWRGGEVRTFYLPLLTPWSPSFPQIMKVFRFLTEREKTLLSHLSAEQTRVGRSVCRHHCSENSPWPCPLPSLPCVPNSPPSSGTVVLCSVFASSPLLPAHSQETPGLGGHTGRGTPL